MILITGANGITGHALIPKLIARGASVRALDIVPAAMETLKAMGAEPVLGNMRDVNSLRNAMRGVRTVYHIPPRMQADELQLGKNAIEAAKKENVEHFVYHSVTFPYVEDVVFHWEKMKVEVEVIHSGMPFTIMEPTNYMQNIAWTWNRIIETGEFTMPYSADQPITWVDLEDVGEAVANVLTESNHEGAVYQLCGPDGAMTRHQLASTVSRVLKRNVKAATMQPDEYLKLPYWQGRKPEDMERLKTAWRHYNLYGFRCGNPKVLSMLLGRKPTSYEEFIRRFIRSRMESSDTHR